MKLFIDTTGDDFALALLNQNNYCLEFILLKNVPKKVKLLVENTEKLLKKNKININEITDFYLNLGPGYFTGVRIALVYVRTIALITKAQINTISSMQILIKQNPLKNNFLINASGSKVYAYQNTNNKIFDVKNIEILDNENVSYNTIDYIEIFNNFQNYITLFTHQKDIINIEPYYIKKPQIGGK
ncbi:tRNA (adenosine(37)-N6)-threonylcarbamoyltransferase complex dimerization subunit type 1 TsaB [Mycoplasmopsis phocirhinis]|uniref:tRNA (Adenosine(37)-N6)-threonylcarbamoyltransferase complex dimerization subunit type 1 TsaB n=1 Tax=Mycoplasmopsis phocirhinis TaxID=142650 RepID=A0A4P6MPP4_9BACT|nr:tRNA (adenosine(37)-N6)-threonylcarbamoyltransferase complex dimerization subunit type 1 TsaB [Mycoplasmopsis phocirhinis]QBF34880.1 tRNA (adenosine(37)-N6)-threonylcarbamoyltransferase complex dimerization subunit type 1 TsaB [Mycoplasmopsis phocirhinis]